jgi:arylsulfatase A-like enzyme
MLPVAVRAVEPQGWRARVPGVRMERYTYVRDLDGPWLLYDNIADPYQLTNLVNRPEYAPLQQQLEERLKSKLAQTRDDFRSGWTTSGNGATRWTTPARWSTRTDPIESTTR